MSDILKFVFYYGLVTVQSNEMGVYLSEFKFGEMDLNTHKTWTVEHLNDWLTTCFQLNPDVYIVGVHAL
jgi:hypothetical protein